MTASEQLPRSKRVLFAFAPSAFLLLLLLAAEGALRLFWPSLGNPLVEPIKLNGIEWYQVNRRHLSKYFSPSVVLLPEIKTTVFRVAKQPNTVRILCLGESTMFGVPYQMSSTIPAIVRKQLRHAYPNADFEVINAAASAINSNVILDLAREFIAYQPDCVLLYSGHNEYYGPDGVSAPWIERMIPGLIRFKYATRDWYLMRLIERWIASPDKAAAADPNMMKEVSRGTLVPLNSPDVAWVTQNYERNIRELIRLFQERNIPVIVSDLTSNLLFAPFASSRAGVPILEDPRTPICQRLLAQDSVGSLLAESEEWLNQDSTDAAAFYWAGRAFLKTGRVDEAHRALARARDFDLLKFRAPTPTTDRLQVICREYGVPLLPTDSLIAAQDVNGLPGSSLFWEHVHLHSQGYALMADLFLQALARTFADDARLQHPVTPPLPFDRDSLAIAWLDEAYADYAMLHLTTRWPFTNVTVTPAALPLADSVLRGMAYDVYTGRLNWGEGCFRSAEHFRQAGDYRRAIATYRALVDDYPFHDYAWYQLGMSYQAASDFSRAIDAYTASIAASPTYPYARLNLGLLLVNRGQFKEAESQFRSTLRLLTPRQRGEAATAWYGLAAVAANLNDFEMALRSLDSSLSFVPSYASAVQLRQQILSYRASHK